MINILFTGLNGFLGKNFLSYINNEDLDLNLISLNRLSKTSNDYDYDSLEKYLTKEGIDKIDVLVHAGAFSPKTRSQMNDVYNCIQNILSTNNLIKNISFKPRKIIYISSISVSGSSIYGLSKLLSERIIIQFAEENNIEYQILRLGVMYGNNKEYQGLIPTFIDNIMQNKEICVFNEGVDLRTFIYIEDVCKVIYQSILQKTTKHFIVDVVNNQKISIKELAEKLIKISNNQIKIKNVTKDYAIVEKTKASALNESFNIKQKTYDEGLKKAFDFFKREIL